MVFRNVASSVLGPALSVGCLMSEEGKAAVRPSDTILKKRKVVETEFYQEFASLSKILSLGEEHPKLKLEFGVTDV